MLIRSSRLYLLGCICRDGRLLSAEVTCRLGTGEAVLLLPMSDFREAAESISEAQCAEHPGSSVAGACTRCGTFMCAFCALSWTGRCFGCLHVAPELATRRARLAASLVDGAALLLPSLLLGALRSLAIPDEVAMNAPVVYAPVLFVLFWQARLIRGTGASLGKRLLGIQVVRGDGRPAEVWRIALLRNALPLVFCGYCGWVGLADVLLLVGEDRRCLHDWVAGTRVVKAPRAQRSLMVRLVTG